MPPNPTMHHSSTMEQNKPAYLIVDDNMVTMARKKNAFSAMYHAFRDYIRNQDGKPYL